jgi:ATP-dependent DNA helicase RecQ
MAGMALSIYGDAGWGHLVREGKYTHGHFEDTLVEASADLIADRWAPDPTPTWVTSIPSSTRPALVRDFAVALAGRLGLEYHDALIAEPGHSQKDMENSVQQLRNVHAKVSVAKAVLARPVLLVDDIVDSGWTLAYAGWLLGTAGATAVYPFALAAASRGDA